MWRSGGLEAQAGTGGRLLGVEEAGGGLEALAGTEGVAAGSGQYRPVSFQSSAECRVTEKDSAEPEVQTQRLLSQKAFHCSLPALHRWNSL